MAQKVARSTFWFAPDLGRFWTVPNGLSLLRLVLIVPITYLILVEGPLTWILGLLVVAIFTDWADGIIARWSHTESEWGRVLDPLADKVGAAAIALALVLRGSLPLWFLGVVVARDAFIVLGGIVLVRRTGVVLASMRPGKWAVGLLALTILAALLRADPPVMTVLLTATTALLVYSFMRYAIRFWQVLRASRSDTDPTTIEGAEQLFGQGLEETRQADEPPRDAS